MKQYAETKSGDHSFLTPEESLLLLRNCVSGACLKSIDIFHPCHVLTWL
jgi:hypothetical protein